MVDRRRKGGRARSHGGKKEKKVYPEFTGRVQMTRDGYAFIIVDGEEDDIFVKASKTRGALNGDTVRVAVTKEKTDRQRKSWSARASLSSVYSMWSGTRRGC